MKNEILILLLSKLLWSIQIQIFSFSVTRKSISSDSLSLPATVRNRILNSHGAKSVHTSKRKAMKREIEKSSLHCILIRYKSLSLLNSWSEFSGFVGRLHLQFSLFCSPHLHQTSPTHNTSDEQPELHFRHSIDFTGFRYHRANACSTSGSSR